MQKDMKIYFNIVEVQNLPLYYIPSESDCLLLQ